MESSASPGSVEGFESITLISADGSTVAEFVPDANMLCCSFKFEDNEFLDHGTGVRAYAEQGKTMGVPLLHPWANRLSGFGYRAAGKSVTLPKNDPRIPVDPAGLPIHGALPGLLRWEAEPTSSTDELTARLDWSSEQLLELFPFPHQLELRASVGTGELTLATSLAATADDPVPVSFGYHPYMRSPACGRESWRVTIGAFRQLKLDERMIPTGPREPVKRRSFLLADTSLDDAFDALAVPAEFEAAAGDVSLRVEFLAGYQYAQVYAPAGEAFICFEPMTAPTNALNSGDGLQIVPPGETYRAEFRLSVSRSPH